MSASRSETTHWSLVLAARDRAEPGADDALASLCALYQYPLYAYIRRRGHGGSPSSAVSHGPPYSVGSTARAGLRKAHGTAARRRATRAAEPRLAGLIQAAARVARRRANSGPET